MTISAKAKSVERYFEGIFSADESILRSVCTQDFRLVLPQPTVNQEMSGAEAFGFLVTVPRTFLDLPSVTTEVIFSVESADSCAVEMAIRGDAVNGGRYENRYCLFYLFDGDLISLCREHADVAYTMTFAPAAPG